MLQKNQVLKCACTALGADFEGICRHEGQVLFVPGALPLETVRVKVIKVAKSYAVGRLEEVLAPSDARVAPLCPYYPRCGGCTAQHMAYAATLDHKHQQVVDCLERIGGFGAPMVFPCLGMDDPWRYRNKGAFPVGGEVGSVKIGCYAARSHDIVDAPMGCLLQTGQSDALVGAVRLWMEKYRVAPYQEEGHTGLIRHIMTREAKDGGAMLVIVANGKKLPQAEALVEMAREAAPSLRSVMLSVNTKRTNVILGDTFETLWGESSLEDEIAGMKLRVSPPSFFQVNRGQAEKLYATTLDFAGLTGQERVWDVYCGCGSITLPLCKAAKEVTGIEIVEEAVADARVNAARNGIDNACFLAGAAETVLPELAKKQGAPDVVVVDPPRKGCEAAALQAIADVKPKKIVYVSCNPATLARDAKLLAEKGYRLDKAQPVDMFGWTGHVECVLRMRRGFP